MDKIRLQEIDLVVAEPLGYDVYDGQNRLLLNRGHVISSEVQLERLLERGAYGIRPEVEAVRRRMGRAPAAADRPKPQQKAEVSVFDWAKQAQGALAALLASNPQDGSFSSKLLEIAAQLQRCCTADADAALACIFVVRHPSYSIRQACNAALLCEVVGRTLGVDERARLSVVAAALTMNIALMELQDVLYKQREPLTTAQKLAVLKHPEQAEERLRALGVQDAVWLRAVREHHEANDGSGYPARLAAPAIAFESALVSIADQFCAMVTERELRPPVAPGIALRKLFTERQVFDAKLAAALVKEIGIYPPGSLVRLKNGDMALVVRRTRNANHPVVRALVSPTRRTLDGYPKRLTTKAAFEVAESLSLDKLGNPLDQHGRPVQLESLWDLTVAAVKDDGELELAQVAATG
jgi:HD-GYP domain-containing protein (c-di-GMP phosphodiesterase class II)